MIYTKNFDNKVYSIVLKYENCENLLPKYTTNSNNLFIKFLFLLTYLFSLLCQIFFFSLTWF